MGKLDKFIQGKVINHKTPVNTDALWQQIEAKQNKEKKNRKFIFFWFLLSGLILTAAVSTFFIQKNYTKAKQDIKTEIETRNEVINEINNKKLIETGNENISEIDNEKSIGKFESRTNFDDENKLVNSTQTRNEGKSIFNKNLQDGSYYYSTNNSGNNTKESSVINSNSMFNSNTKMINSNSMLKNNTVFNLPTNFNNPIGDVKGNSITLIENKEEESIEKKLEKINKEIEFVEFKEGFLNIPETKIDSSLKKNKSYNNPPKVWKLASSAYGTYGKYKRNFFHKNDFHSNLLAHRDSLEKPLDVFRIGTDFRLKHKTGLYAKVGLEYEQMNERYKKETTIDSSYYGENVLLEIIVDIEGNPIDSTYGPGLFIVRNTLEQNVYNRYKMLDIPLSLGYTWDKKRFGFFVESGIGINLLFKQNGEIYEEGNTFVRLEDRDDVFVKNKGLSILGSCGLNYKVSKNVELWASPSIKYHLKSFTQRSYSIEQKYKNYGFQLGLRFNWN